MTSLPADIITDILSRQPVKTLLRFRCVSKPWCSLIDGPDFIKVHLERSSRTYSYTGIILRHKKFYYLNLDSKTVAKLDNPLETPSYGDTELLGSCNGLVCLSNMENDVALWNPSTRKHHILPVSPIRIPNYEFLVYGFGYDHINDDYKVMRIVQRCGIDDDSLKTEVMVYNLKLNSWRRAGDFPYELCYRREWGVFVSGALHYVAMSDSNPEITLIVAFDLDGERYRLLPHPERVENNTHMLVGVFGGKLCVFCTCPEAGINIWVMQEYAVKESWTKLISISPLVMGSYFVSVRPLAFSNNGDAVLVEWELPDGVKLIWYDLKKKKLKKAKFQGVPKVFEPMFFVESLVSLKGDNGIGRKMQLEPEEGKKKKNGKKRDDFLSSGFKLVL